MITVSGNRAGGSREDRAVRVWTRLRQRQLDAARRGRVAQSAHYAALARRIEMRVWRGGSVSR